MFSSLILAWLVCWGPGEVLLQVLKSSLVQPVRLIDRNISQKSVNPAFQKPAFKWKTSQADSTKSWTSPSGDSSWRKWRKVGKVILVLPICLVRSDFCEQSRLSFLVSCYLLSVQRKEKGSEWQQFICIANQLLFFFSLGIFLTCKTYYITTCFPLKMNSVRFTHFCLLKRYTNIASIGQLCM